MDGFAREGKGGFFEGLGEGGMGVAGVSEGGGGGAGLEGEGRFGDQLAGVGSEDMGAEKGVCFGAGDEFDEADGVAGGAGAGIGHEGKFSGFDGEVFSFGLFFGQANGADFGMGIDDVGDSDIFDMGAFSCDEFGDGDPLFRGFMGEHGAIDKVSDSKDMGMGGPKIVIDGEEASLIGGDLKGFEAEPLGVGAATDGDENFFGGEGLFSFDLQGDAGGRDLCTGDF